MGRRFVPRGGAPNGGLKRTAKAESDVHVCIGALVSIDGGGKGVLYHMARSSVAYPSVPVERKPMSTFVLTASDIAWSALNAQSAGERQLMQWGIGFEKLTGRPLPKDRAALQQETIAIGGGHRRW